ncbi:MAG: 50S ribosome-binding GTPase [Rhodoferax sp.]|nr:50S ribosome-binding GTPase [Rhodoferax sp.]
MKIVKYYHHRGKLEELSRRHSAFEKIKGTVNLGVWHEWTDSDTKEISCEKMMIFVGKTGYGKSTTVNVISGTNYFQTSDVSSCTRVCQCVDYRVQGRYWLSLGDLPGVGENQVRDEEYFKLYQDFLGYASVIIHVIRADARDYSIDEETTRRLFMEASIKKRIVYALGQCDKIEPLDRKSDPAPTELQMQNSNKKIAEVKRVFSPVNAVVPYSATTQWNLHGLTSEIVRVALSLG